MTPRHRRVCKNGQWSYYYWRVTEMAAIKGCRYVVNNAIVAPPLSVGCRALRRSASGYTVGFIVTRAITHVMNKAAMAHRFDATTTLSIYRHTYRENRLRHIIRYERH